MKRFFRNIFKPKPAYEPAGIIHYGSFQYRDYYGEATPHRTHHIWHGDYYLGEYEGSQLEILTQLATPEEPSRATPEHHSQGAIWPHLCVCGKPLNQH